jgi:hypothetical protein
MPMHKTRESWLNEAVEHLTELYGKTSEDGDPVSVPTITVGVGFPLTGGRKSIGTCWPTKASSDGLSQVFVSPKLGEGDEEVILGVLIHEMAHAIDDCESGHRGRFVKLCDQMGLVGPWTATSVSEALSEILKPVRQVLGTYPAGKLDIGLSIKKPQKNRQLLAECKHVIDTTDAMEYEALAEKVGETCPYKARSSKLIWSIGIPDCPIHGDPLEVEDKDDPKDPDPS